MRNERESAPDDMAPYVTIEELLGGSLPPELALSDDLTAALDAGTLTIGDCWYAHAAGADLDDYWAARETGVSHAEIVEILSAGIDLWTYTEARTLGASHTQILEVSHSGASLGWYTRSRQDGGSHAEIIEAHRMGATLAAYAKCRARGLPHRHALARSWCP